ncbi:MAG: signal transduction histidine kinase, partial [Gammaproteobacteria bacterium]
ASELKALIHSRDDQRTQYQQFSFGALLLMLAALSAHLFFARSGPGARFTAGREIEDTLDLSSDTLHLYDDNPSSSPAKTKQLSPNAAQRIEQEYLLQALRASGQSLSSHMNLLTEIQHDVSSALDANDAQAGASARLKEVQDIMKEKSADKVLLAMHRTVRTIDRAAKEIHHRARAMIEVERGAFDLVKCVERAIDAESNLHPTVNIERELLPSAMTTGAAQDITAVIQSILANSMQSFDNASTSPVLRVQMSQDQNNVTVTVTDNGPGMDQKIRQAAVAAFYSSKDGHSGLGLSVALYIAKKHGGTLQLNSVPGKGTAVRLILPANSGN